MSASRRIPGNSRSGMRYLSVVLSCVACGGGASSTPSPPLANTARTVCSVIPEGDYLFGGARTEEELFGGDTESGRCTTPFENGAQQLVCEQGAVHLRGALAQAKDGVHVAGYDGALQYSDAVVLLGTLRTRDGATLAVRLELRCPTVDAC